MTQIDSMTPLMLVVLDANKVLVYGGTPIEAHKNAILLCETVFAGRFGSWSDVQLSKFGYYLELNLTPL